MRASINENSDSHCICIPGKGLPRRGEELGRMSIRFRCDQCAQKLRVSDDKAGLQAKCPKCKASVTVPAHKPAADEPEPATDEPGPSADPPAAGGLDHESPSAPEIRTDGLRDQTLPEIVIRDDSVDWVYKSDQPLLRAETVVDYDKVAVPRRVLYLQGGLLGVVALVSFVLGMLVGDRSAPRESGGLVPQPCVLSGQITYGGDIQSRPDGGSVVIVLPADRRPATDARVAIEGLRPGDPVPVDENISLRTIRGLGGDYVRANDDGMYRIRLPENGRYHVLMISRRSSRSANERLAVTDVAQIGRYFANVVDLLDDRRYQWQTLALRGDATLDATF